jgi:hypothetical protein
MNAKARLELSLLIGEVRATHPEPLVADRRPRTCPKCATVGSWITHEDTTYHIKQGDKLRECTVLGSRECLFCHYVEDRV